MAPETTGAGTAKSKDPGMTGSDLTGMTEEERDQVASKLVDRFSLWSGAAGLIPIPLVDMAAVGGVQLQMLRRLSEIYGVPFSEAVDVHKHLLGRESLRQMGEKSLREPRVVAAAIGDENLAGHRIGDWPADDAGVLRRRHLRDRQGFHPAFCFGWDAA